MENRRKVAKTLIDMGEMEYYYAISQKCICAKKRKEGFVPVRPIKN